MSGPHSPRAFAVVGSRHLLHARSSVRLDTLEGPDGATFEREVVEHDDAVAVVAVDADGRVALVRQYRHPTGAYLLEIPAGTLDVPGEPVEAAALRELAEEAGLAADELRPLGRVWNSAGWSDEATTLLLATGLRPVPPPAGYVPRAEEAVIEVTWRPLDELVHEALDGTLTDAKTIVGVLRAAAALDVGGPVGTGTGPGAGR
jgi:8-oxo-dGTP pyrophosphatase MutT (NUDIX family)